MAPDKSLAAEIEAAQIIFEAIYPHLRYERQSPENRKPFERAAAALQSRAFEDGARKRLADALAVYDAAERDLAAAKAVHHDVCQRMVGKPDIGEIMDRVGAEQACMRRSMARGIAWADLVSAVRAALQPEGERNA